MNALFGQISTGDGQFTERQWVFLVKLGEEETHRRLLMQTYRPLGIRFLTWAALEKMNSSPQWPLKPQREGLRRRAQETADERMFSPRPFMHIGDSQHKELDVDPENTRSSVYGGALALQSCYLLNPLWYMEQGIWNWFDITKEFAFKVLKVDNFTDMKAVVLGKAVTEGGVQI